MSVIAPLLADDTNILTDDKSKAGYAIGMMLGHNLKGADVDVNLILRGFKDEESGSATLLTSQEAQNVLREFQQNLAASLGAKNKTEGEAFLAQNKDRPGVVTLPDGLQYKIITDGSGATPAPTDTVTMNYRGTFVDGTEFDNSIKRGQPLQIQLERIPFSGWREALLKMKAGSKWQLFIPSDLAYGGQGRPGIAPNATLIFEVELLSVQTLGPQPAPAASATPPLTSDIVEVRGTNFQIIKAEDLQKLQSQSRTN